MGDAAVIGAACGDPLALDAPWMTEALESAGVAGGASVTDVEFDGFIGTGQMSRNARYRLTWDDPTAGRRPSSASSRPHDDDTKRRSFESGVYHHEYAFYDQLAATVAIRTPQCWVARFDAAAPDFVLIMEDLADSAQGDQFSEPSDEVTTPGDRAGRRAARATLGRPDAGRRAGDAVTVRRPRRAAAPLLHGLHRRLPRPASATGSTTTCSG